MNKPVRRANLRDIVADRLRAYITDGGLKPGDRLPTETAFAEKFEVSRLSLREATKALEFLGIIESKAGVGLTVGHVSVERMTAHLGFHPDLHDASPTHLVEARVVVETGVLPYIVDRMREDPACHESLDRINGELREVHDSDRWIELDIAFHHQLVEASGLAPLLAFNDLLASFFRRFRESVTHGESKAGTLSRQWKSGIRDHQRVIDALRDGRPEAARKVLITHIRSNLKNLGISRPSSRPTRPASRS